MLVLLRWFCCAGLVVPIRLCWFGSANLVVLVWLCRFCCAGLVVLGLLVWLCRYSDCWFVVLSLSVDKCASVLVSKSEKFLLFVYPFCLCVLLRRLATRQRCMLRSPRFSLPFSSLQFSMRTAGLS